MANKNMIIGIAVEIEDPNTGAPAAFHVLSDLHTSWKYARSTATVDSYASRKSYEMGKSPMGSQTVQLYGAPSDGQCSKLWAYRSIVAPIAEGSVDDYGNPILPHDFTGAELIEKPA